MSEIKYEIIKKLGVLSKFSAGWAKEVNLISWNERDPKYDIREWSPASRCRALHPSLIVS